MIYNEWFRDQNLQQSIPVDKDNGPDSASDYVLRKRGKRHDYFTSALPWPQKGPSVELPLGTAAPITYEPIATINGSINGNVPSGPNRYITIGSDDPMGYDPAGTLVADLSDATAATINQLRVAFQIQKLYERDARGGTR